MRTPEQILARIREVAEKCGGPLVECNITRTDGSMGVGVDLDSYEINGVETISGHTGIWIGIKDGDKILPCARVVNDPAIGALLIKMNYGWFVDKGMAMKHWMGQGLALWIIENWEEIVK